MNAKKSNFWPGQKIKTSILGEVQTHACQGQILLI